MRDKEKLIRKSLMTRKRELLRLVSTYELEKDFADLIQQKSIVEKIDKALIEINEIDEVLNG